jgi:hypothetical protein
MVDSDWFDIGIIIKNKQFKILCLQKTVLSFVHENFFLSLTIFLPVFI